MTKKNGTKRSLLMSAVALVLCFSMLVGSTFAWFTDSVTSSNNIIASGKLDVEMMWANGTADPNDGSTSWNNAATSTIFNYSKWEPGYVDAKHIMIKNAGNLALKYQLNIVADGDPSDLTDVIDVYYFDGAEQITARTQLTADHYLGTLTQALAGMSTTASGNLEENENHTVTIALKMQESAGNEYMDKSIGSSFAVQLLATQLSNESDSFGNTYDQTATYPNGVFVSAPIEAAPATVENGAFTYTSDDNTVKVDGTAAAGSNVTVTVVPTATSDNLVEIVDNTGKSVVSYNIDVEGHDEDEVVTVQLFVGKNLVGVEVYHAGTKMTSGATYDAASGYVTIITDSFSPFEIVFYSAEDVPAASAGVTTAAELQKVLNDGGYAVLANDIAVEDNKRIDVPAGTTAVLDLNGHTLTSKDGGGDNTMAIYIDKGAVLTLNDSVGTGEIVSSCYGVYVKQNAKFIMNGGTIEVSGNGVYDYGVVVWNADFVMNGGTINAQGAVCASNYFRDEAGETGLNTCYVKIADGCTINSTVYDDVYFNEALDAVIDVPDGVSTYPALVDTADELEAAITNGYNVILTDDINMEVTKTGFTVANGTDVTIDLNGHDIVATSDVANDSVQLFSVNGNLNIVGNGTVSLTSDNFAWSNDYRYCAINIRETGVVTLGEGVEVVCEASKGGSYGMSYAVDIYTTGTLNVNGASLHSNYIAVRCFYGASVVNVNSGSSITSSRNNWGIWPQSATGAVITVASDISYTINDSFGIYIFD